VRRLSATAVNYGLVVAFSFSPFIVLAVYFVRVVHMSPLQLVLTGTVMEAAVFLFEVPTGAFADTYGRRLSLVVAFVIQGLAIVLVGAVPRFWVIALAWGIWGFGYTFESGAWEAWLADEIGVDRLGGVLMRASRLGYASGIVGLLAGVGVGLWNLQAAVIMGGAITAAAGVACIFVMPESGWSPRPRADRSHPAAELVRTARAGAGFVRLQPLILLLLGATFVAGASSEAFDRLWEAHFIRDIGLPHVGSLDPIVWFGLFGILVSLVGLVASTVLIRRFENADSPTLARGLLWMTVVLMGACAGFGLAHGLAAALAALLVARAMRSLLAPVYTAWLNRQITDSSVRATVISIAGQADAVGQAGGGPALGAVGNAFGIRAALVSGALLLAPAIALYARAVAHHGDEPELDALPADAAV
jgi:DHA3 family tetracycline resistance protein-like MFS transporter